MDGAIPAQMLARSLSTRMQWVPVVCGIPGRDYDLGMAIKLVLRARRVDDFIADSLEREAGRIPPSHRPEIEALLQHASLLRNSQNSKMIMIWEEIDQQ